MGVNKGNVKEKRDSRIAFSQEVQSSINTPEGMHLFFGQMVRTADPSIGGDAVGHSGIDFCFAVMATKPMNVIVFRSPGGVGKLHVIKTVSTSRWEQMGLADHFSLVSGFGQLASQSVGRIPISDLESYQTRSGRCHAGHK